MSLGQSIQKGVGGTLSIDVQTRPSSVTVKIYTGRGDVVLNATAANISNIATTLNGAVSRGGYSLTVASNNGMLVGKTFHLQDDPEEVLIRKVSGTTIYVRRPFLYDHANSAVIESGRIEYAVNSNIASSFWWDGRAEWNIDGELFYSACECTQYPMQRLATSQDLFDIEPKIYHMIDDEADIERLLDLGMDQVLSRLAAIAPDIRARVYPGTTEFRHATALAALYIWYMRQPGDVAKDLFERYRAELDAEVNRVCVTTPRDANQDGIISQNERISGRSGALRR
jgi:hypothetical protein